MTTTVIWFLLTLLIVIDQDAEATNYKKNNLMSPNDFLFNISHIIIQSVLFCGPNIICDKSLLTLLDIPNLSEPGTTRCGNCSCNASCVSLQNCCPDIFFKHGLRECKDVNVLSKGPLLNEIAIFSEVVASCPIGTCISLSRKCTKDRFDVDALLHPPVTSDVTKVSYRNKYCAICNKATDWEEWHVKFECKTITDFNFLSSYQEIIDLALEEDCSVIPTPPVSLSDCDFDLHGVITLCNVTESWHNYDEQVERACLSSYVHPMGVFKNIFCAICNPPEFDKDFLVDRCENSTSVNKNACRVLPFLEASFPYKNHFCFVCTQGFENSVFYTDVDVKTTSEIYHKNYEYPFKFTVSFAYNYATLNHYIGQYVGASNSEHKIVQPLKEDCMYRKDQLECLPKSDENMFPPLAQENGFNAPQYPPHLKSLSYMKDSFSIIRVPLINITNLIRKSFAFTRHGACTPGLLPDYSVPLQKPCSCTLGCRSDCCVDFALKVPWTCINDHYFRNGTTNDYLAIGGCIEDKNLEDLCRSNTTSPFYHMFPMTSETGYNETYVNVFCYLCNTNVNHRSQTNINGNFAQDLEVWPLEVKCKTYINYRNFHLLENLIEYFNREACVLSFLPHSRASKCSDTCYEDDFNAIGRCNISGTWTNFDEDVFNACENMGTNIFPPVKMNKSVYKNKFCKICNPFQATLWGSNCSSLSEDSSAIVVKACQEFPIINACFPFENVFCEMCMNNASESQCYQEPKMKEESGKISPVFTPPVYTTTFRPLPEAQLTFRTLFSLRAYDTPSILNEEEKLEPCQQNQILNRFEQTCWNLTCFPGKVLRNNRCVSLLPITSNLRYTIAIKIELSTFIVTNATVQESLERLREYVTIEIKKLLRTHIIIEDITLMSSVSCDDMFFKVSEVYLYLVLFIDSNVYRDQMEQKLINFTESSTIWNSSNISALIGKTVELKLKISRIQLLQPWWKSNLISNIKRTKHCVVINEDYFLPTQFVNVFVSPLLACPQILLKENETGLNWVNNPIENTFLGLKPSVHHTSDNDGIRVCARSMSDIKKQISMDSYNTISPLTIVTLICIIISLFCLIVTFVTYCIFPSLRTLPGINNMCLVASLFLAQLLMIIRPYFNSSSLVAASVLSHLSWLSTFFWLQICSFHMFRVFSAKGQSKFLGGKRIKLIMQYSLYAFGISVVIVTSNVIISMIVTNGRNTGYDKMSTLMTYKIAFITTLVIPIAFVSLTNIIFYIFTAYKIYSSPKIENTTRNRIHFGVYVKLFTLTGLSWILQIVDMLFELSAFSYFVAILNGLQGLFIFVSYVCNRRVWKMYATLCCSHTVYRSVSSSKTNKRTHHVNLTDES